MSSTLSVFLKPMSEDLGVSRGVFSLLRSGEILIAGAMAPWVGPMVDRYGGRWLMAGGALSAVIGFLWMSQVGAFWQFLILRWTFVAIGGVFMCQMVVSVTLSRWFVRKRGRAIAIAGLGQGVSKVCIPVVTASLFVWVGWRLTWSIFGVVTLILVVLPALIFMRRSPEDMGLRPDGIEDESHSTVARGGRDRGRTRQPTPADEVIWTRRQVIRTRTFWAICFIYGMVNVGIAGLNLHVFAYVTDAGYSSIAAATVLGIIASTQLASTLIWGLVSERMPIRFATLAMFLMQSAGLTLVLLGGHILPLYAGFFFYGIGLGGSWVLQEIIWASCFGRMSLGVVRGLGLLVTYSFAAAGAPFFGFVHDLTGNYQLSFIAFAIALMLSAFLGLTVRPPSPKLAPSVDPG